MQYRPVPKTGWNVSTLSYGCMRFKDEATAFEAVNKAIDLGVNYYDVAPLYGWGAAEPFLGKAIKGRREGLIITAKSSPGNGGAEVGEHDPKNGFGIQTADQARRQIERSMEILGVDHLDMYQLWACHGEAVFQQAIAPGGFLEGVLKARDEGLFDYIGITTHGGADEIIHYLKDSTYEFDMVTLPFHLRDTSRAKAIQYCAERGIGVVAMNPLAGGNLVRPVAALQRIATDLGLGNMAQASLRYVAGYPGVTTALNGITFAPQAIEGAQAIDAGSLSPAENDALITRLNELYANIKHFCTGCGYCGECPMGIQIPKVLEIYSDLLVPSTAEEAMQRLLDKMANSPDGYDPSVCTACKQCEAKCPNKLPIADLMTKAAALWPLA